MKIWRRIPRDAWRFGVRLLIALLVLVVPASAGALSSLQADSAQPLVIDRAGILDDGQEQSAVNDVYRLNLYGIPTLVVTEPVGLTQSQADARADELRVSQGIETFPNANDGLLFYVSTDPYDQANIVMSISTGSQTLPRNGFDAESLDGIRVEIMDAQLAAGHPARAIVYSLREMIYLEQYVPPPPPALSGWRSDAKSIGDVLTPVLAVTGSAWLLRQWRRNHAARDGIGITLKHVLLAGALAAGLIFVAVATRSQTGALAAMVLGGLVIWQAVALDRTPQPGFRAMTLSPRRPGSRWRSRSAGTPAR